jgi:transporter family protein
MSSFQVWFYWALLSAVFASLTAILAKIGLEGVDSDFATLIRTVIILIAITWFVYATGKWRSPFALPPGLGVFLLFPVWLPARHGSAIFAPCKPAMPPKLRRIN